MPKCLPGCLLIFLSTGLLTLKAQWDPPPGYYDSASGLSGNDLRDALHDIIDNHTVIPYTSSAPDTWDALKDLDRDPDNIVNVLLIYSAASIPRDDTNGGGNPDVDADSWEREHLWPRSYGIGQTGADSSDLFNLRPCRRSVNSSRGNRLYDDADPDDPLDPAIAPPNCPQCFYDYLGLQGFLWAPRPSEKGDIARAMFYMAVRYDGSDSGTTDLELSNTPDQNSSIFGVLDTLIRWHEEDPVSDEERRRNQLIYDFYQYNRNPFVDHPQFVSSIFGATQPFLSLEFSPNIVPENSGQLVATVQATPAPSGNLIVTVSKTGDSDDSELSVPASITITGGQVTTDLPITVLTDNFQDGDQAVTLSVSAAGYAGDAGVLTVSDIDAPTGPSEEVWINEFHYDNAGADTGEFVEVVVAPGFSGDLTGIEVFLYNGASSSRSPYQILNGSEATDHGLDSSGYRFLSWSLPVDGIQNGSPDGLALVVNSSLIEFLSYEGTFIATTGPATGFESSDIGAGQNAETPVGSSLERQGTGSGPSDFTWFSVPKHSQGFINTNQTLLAGNTPPEYLTESTGYVAVVGASFSLVLRGQDSDDGDTLSFSSPLIPPWLTLVDRGRGLASLSGTPGSKQADTVETVQVLLSDGTDSVLQPFEIEVRSTLTNYLLQQGVSPDQTRSGDNTDGDAHTQLEEYALGGNALESKSLVTLQPITTASYPRISFLRRKNDPELVIEAQVNTRLGDEGSWSSAQMRQVGNPQDVDENYERVVFESIMRIHDEHRQFLRVRVDRPSGGSPGG